MDPCVFVVVDRAAAVVVVLFVVDPVVVVGKGKGAPINSQYNAANPFSAPQ